MRKELLKELQNKFVFFDFDGTLAEYRFDGRILSDDDVGEQMLDKLLFADAYENVRPLATMQKFVEKLDSNKIFVIGAVLTGHEIECKRAWLAKHFPNFKAENMFFVSDSAFKVKILQVFAKKFKQNYEDIVLVDDKHSTIYAADRVGFVAYHPSSFVD